MHFEVADALAAEGLHIFDEEIGAEGDVAEDGAETELRFFKKLVATFAGQIEFEAGEPRGFLFGGESGHELPLVAEDGGRGFPHRLADEVEEDRGHGGVGARGTWAMVVRT